MPKRKRNAPETNLPQKRKKDIDMFEDSISDTSNDADLLESIKNDENYLKREQYREIGHISRQNGSSQEYNQFPQSSIKHDDARSKLHGQYTDKALVDDEEGNLNYRIGHVFLNKYRVIRMAGVGVYSRVLFAEILPNGYTSSEVPNASVSRAESHSRGAKSSPTDDMMVSVPRLKLREDDQLKKEVKDKGEVKSREEQINKQMINQIEKDQTIHMPSSVNPSLKPGKQVAIKILRNNEFMQRAGNREIKILQVLHENDPNGDYHCLELYDSFEYKNHLCLVLERYDMNLRSWIFQNGAMKLNDIIYHAYSLLKALYLLKHCEYIHGDLKPDNILINIQSNRVVLSDFGTSFHDSDAGISPLLQSGYYRAPEVILGYKHTYAVDMFSLGCTLYELFTGKILFESKSILDHLKLILKLKGPLPKKMRTQKYEEGIYTHEYFNAEGEFLDQVVDPGDSTRILVSPCLIEKQFSIFDLLRSNSKERNIHKLRQFADLLERMLTIDPKKRITIEHAFYHDFFQT